MRNFIISVLLALAIIACNNNQSPKVDEQPVIKVGSDTYSITGKVMGMDSGWIYFAHEDTTGKLFGKIDSIPVINEQFEMHGKLKEPERLIVGVSNKRSRFFSPTIFLDRGHTILHVDKDSLEGLTASGNPSQDQYNAFRVNYDPLVDASNNNYGLALKARKTKDLSMLNKLRSDEDAILKQQTLLVINEVKNNPNTLVSAYILLNHLPRQVERDRLEPVYAWLSDSIKKSIYGKRIQKKIGDFHSTYIGGIAPGFEIPDARGKMITLKSFRGTYTLIDFWASWCGPCRGENPNLLRAYNAYKDKGFTIVGVSLDMKKGDWLKAVQEDKMPWTQLCDLKGGDSEVANLYGIEFIPMNFLLDKEGRIIATGLRGNELEKKLAKVLN